MSGPAVILVVFPEALDVNGDSQNAEVLAQRARWAGIDVEVQPLLVGGVAPVEAPAAVVLGSGVDADLRRLRAALDPVERAMRAWAEAGVPILGVGTGFELLLDGIRPDRNADPVAGIGILDGIAEPLEHRATDDLVVDTEHGRLFGYENHARGLTAPSTGSTVAPAGSIVRGTGNGDGREGARRWRVVGTRLHGPVLAKNPRLADSMLTAAFGDRYRADDPRIRRVDETARAAREVIAKRLGVELDAPVQALGPGGART